MEPGERWAEANPSAAKLPSERVTDAIQPAGSGRNLQGDSGSRSHGLGSNPTSAGSGGTEPDPPGLTARKWLSAPAGAPGNASSVNSPGGPNVIVRVRAGVSNSAGAGVARIRSGVSRVFANRSALEGVLKMPATTLGRISLLSILVVIAIIVGGIVVLTDPHSLSFAEYWKYVLIGGGITAVGRGIDSGTGTAP